MARKTVRKTTVRKATGSKSMTIVGFWLIGLVTAFLLLGSIARPLLWIFVLGAIVSYYTLKNR